MLRVVDFLIPKEILAKSLYEITSIFRTKTLMLWLPSSLTSEFPYTEETEINVLHIVKDSPVSTKYLRKHLYYTLGDVDWN